MKCSGQAHKGLSLTLALLYSVTLSKDLTLNLGFLVCKLKQ